MSLSISNVFTHTSILLFCCVPLFFLYFPKFSFPTLRILYIRHPALRIPHSRFPLTVLFTYSVSVDSIKYPLLMCRFEGKTGVRTTECGMRSEWCITRDLALEWGISFLLETYSTYGIGYHFEMLSSQVDLNALAVTMFRCSLHWLMLNVTSSKPIHLNVSLLYFNENRPQN